MRSLFHNQTISLSRIVAFFGAGLLLITLFTSAVSASALADSTSTGQRLITIHDRGQDRGLVTDATTLRAAFDEAGIVLDKNDLIEPGLDQELVANNYEVNVYRARPVMVIDGNVRQKVMTPYQTADKIAKAASITLHDEDETTITRSEDIVADGSGLRLTIDRATPFTLVLYGKKVTAYTQETSVSEMMKSKDISLGKDDTLSVAASAPITAGMTVEIWRNGKQTVTEEQAIAFDTEKIQDADRETSYREIKTPGEAGKKNVTYEIEMRNGVEVGRVEIQSVTIQEPKKQVEIVGTKNNFSGSLNEWLLALRTCETGGNYARNSGNGYYGAYQFLPSTWNSIAKKLGRTDLVGVLPSNASPADQDILVIANTNMTAGLSTQHPGCYKKLGLSNKPPQN